MRSELTLRRIQMVAAALGVAIATYITIADSGGGAPVCLAGGHGCRTVADSSYAELLGIRVSVLGIGGYALLFAGALWRGDGGRFASVFLALIGFGFSLYLTYLELFEIDAICQWCVASAVLMTVLFVVTALRAWRFAGSELAGDEANGRSAVAKVAAG